MAYLRLHANRRADRCSAARLQGTKAMNNLINQLRQIAEDLGEPRASIVRCAISVCEDANHNAEEAKRYAAMCEKLLDRCVKAEQAATPLRRVDWPNQQAATDDLFIFKHGRGIISYEELQDRILYKRNNSSLMVFRIDWEALENMPMFTFNGG